MKTFMVLLLALLFISSVGEVEETPPPCATEAQVFNAGLALGLYQVGSFSIDFSWHVDPVTNCCKGQIEVTDTDNITKVWKWEESDCCTTCDIPV